MIKNESKFMLWLKRTFTIRSLTLNALIAALYAVITILCGPLSYVGGSLQLRFSEILNLFVFFNPTFTLGLTIGCLIANIASLYGIFDIVFGTLATLISCLIIVFISKIFKNLLLSGLIPCAINGLVVPLIVYLSSSGGIEMNIIVYLIFFGWTFLGEFICIICIGYPLTILLTKKYRDFYTLIGATQNNEYLF